MVISTKILAALTLASGIGFLALVVLSELYLDAGQGPLDGRTLGYDVSAVSEYVALLSAENLAFYLGPFRMLDTIVPPLMAITFGALIWTLGTTIWRVTLLFPLIYLFADLRENALVGRILKTSGDLDPKLVNYASDMTRLKWLFTVLSLVTVLWLWRKGRTTI